MNGLSRAHVDDRSRRPSILAQVFFVASAFAILYNVSLTVFPPLSSARLAVLLLLLQVVGSGLSLRWPDWRVLLVFLPVPYALSQYPFTLDAGQLSRYAHLALYSFLGAALLASLIERIEVLLSTVLAAVTIQALLILVSFGSMEYRAWFADVVEVASNFDIDELYRAPGLTSTGGSALSVVQSLGVMVGGLLLWIRRDVASTSYRTLVTLAMLVCALSCVVVGRTGMVLSVYFMLLLCFASRTALNLMVILIVLAIPTVFIVLPYLIDTLPDAFSTEFFVTWAFGFFSTGSDESLTDLATSAVPPLGLETVVGTGLVSPINGANPSGHDSGFVQAYFSLGLPMAVVSYLVYAWVLLRLLRWLPPTLQWALAAAFFLIELKEPFLFKYSSMFVLVALFVVAERGNPRRARTHAVRYPLVASSR